jgi:putative membrane protein (TIGR04086 family)
MLKSSLGKFYNKGRAVILSLALFAALALGWTLLTYFFVISPKVVAIGSYSITTLCVVVSSLLNAYLSDGKGCHNGIIGGFTVLALILAVTLLVVRFDFDYVSFLKKVPLYFVISAICGIIGINIK